MCRKGKCVGIESRLEEKGGLGVTSDEIEECSVGV